MATDTKQKRRTTKIKETWYSQTFWILGLVGACDAADAKVLPSLFGVLRRQFGYGPEQLSSLMIAQSLSMAMASPLWGHWTHSYSLKNLLAAGTLTWGVATLGMASTNSWGGLFATRLVAGVSLACMIPLSQAIVGSMTHESKRGTTYGALMGLSWCGSYVGGIFATSVGGTTVLGIDGWRFVLLVIAVISIALSGIVKTVMEAPENHTTLSSKRPHDDEGRTVLKKLCRVRTFQLITLQGCFGAIPWNALSFSTLWLQTSGYSDVAASTIYSWHTIGAALGVFLGGRLGDYASVKSPATGRVRVAQLSKILSMAFAYALFTSKLPVSQPQSALLLSSGFFCLGLVSSWTAAGVNRPILSEVVQDSERASVMAWAIALEGSSAALFGAPVVGMLSERVFGYGKEGSDDAAALSKAMCFMIILPWFVCLSVYGLVAIVYERDRLAAKSKRDLDFA